MIGAVTWLLGSKAGRITAVCLLAAASVSLMLWQVFRRGAAAERVRQAQASLDAWRERISTDDRLSKMPAAMRRAELARWVRDEGDNG